MVTQPLCELRISGFHDTLFDQAKQAVDSGAPPGALRIGLSEFVLHALPLIVGHTQNFFQQLFEAPRAWYPFLNSAEYGVIELFTPDIRARAALANPKPLCKPSFVIDASSRGAVLSSIYTDKQ